MKEKEIKEIITNLSKKEIKLLDLCDELEMGEIEVLGFINKLRNDGINIITKSCDDGIHLFNSGEKDFDDFNTYKFKTDENNEFKFVAISDTRFGSRSQQISILNDIYKKAQDMGYNKVIHCGNMTEGLLPIKNIYADTIFLDDTLKQVDYIVDNYPKVDGIKTYFITGIRDEKHLKKNGINIGKRISDKRSDMVYLGANSCDVEIDNSKMLIFNPKLNKTYTVSYRAQQQVDSFRSEDKPDILLYGGLLQMEKFNYRNVECISVPSVCSTTKEMNDKRQSNTVGAWFVTVKTNSKGEIESVKAIDSVYYETDKEDYKKKPNIITSKVSGNNDSYLKTINKYYRYIKDGMPIEDVMKNFDINFNEVNGIIQLCKTYNKPIDLTTNSKGEIVFSKSPIPRKKRSLKESIDSSKLNHTQLCVVSDTHFGSIHQQLHLLNKVYIEAKMRGIDTVLHCGDMVDGDYSSIRKEQPRQQFLHGFDEQAGYVVDMYPKVKGITTYYILGSHDETHYKNGKATINAWVSRCRNDMIYLGQDNATYDINKMKIVMDHPGGGSAQSLSYKPQKRIETLESLFKPDMMLIGHYHKAYDFVYRNVRGILVPSFCDKTQFQQKQGLSNYVGAYFLDIYSDKKGNIQYFEPDLLLFNHEDMWDEAGRDKKKVKQLVID